MEIRPLQDGNSMTTKVELILLLQISTVVGSTMCVDSGSFRTNGIAVSISSCILGVAFLLVVGFFFLVGIFLRLDIFRFLSGFDLQAQL